jgi:hypothetical protein
MVAWWEAESNALDTVGVNHGILTNGADFAFGKRGFAFALDGVNDYILVPRTPSLSITGALSIEAWIKLADTAPAAPQTIVSKFNPSINQASWALEVANGGVRFIVSADGTTNGNYRMAETWPNIVPANTWMHLMATFDPQTQAMRIFVNTLEPMLTISGGIVSNLFDSAEPVRIGALVGANGVTTNFFPGLLDEVTLYDRVLTSEEVASVFAADTAGKCHPPVIVQPPQSVTVRLGSNATFTVRATGVQPLSFQWRHNAEAIPGATNADLTITSK